MIEGGKLRAREVWSVAFAFCLTFLGTGKTEAVDAQKQVKPFLNSLKSTAYEFGFIRQGLESVHAVKFSDGIENKYQPFFNRIVLQRTMNDGAGNIKKLEALGYDLGTLAHESFHAYKANHIEIDERLSGLKYFLSRRATNLYRSIPEGKRAVTLEEAYASFVGWIVQSHQSMLSTFNRITPENCERMLAGSEDIWNRSWNATITGYWYKDSVLEFWGEQLNGLGVLISEGTKAYQDWRDQEKVHMVEEDLQSLDRRWVAYNLFEGTITSDFKETFKKELEAIDCQ